MNKVPTWIRFSPVDFAHGVRGLSLEEVGAYQLLVCSLYDRGGLFPDNDRMLATLWDCRIDRARRLKTRLLLEGKIDMTAGQLVNERVTRELDNFQRSRDLGQLAAQKRWNINGRSMLIKKLDISKEAFDKDVANLAQYREKLEKGKQQA